MNITGGGSLSDLTALDDDKIQDNHVSSNMGPSDSGHRRGRRGATMAVTTQSQVGQVANPMMVKSGKRGGRPGTPGNNRLAQKVKNASALPQLPPIVTRSELSLLFVCLLFFFILMCIMIVMACSMHAQCNATLVSWRKLGSKMA